METFTKGNLLISLVFILASGYLSISRFLDGRMIDAVLWLIVLLSVVIKEIRRYWNYRKEREE